MGEGTGQFTSPGPQETTGDSGSSLNFQYGQVQTFAWTADIPSVGLVLWQADNQNPDSEDDLDLDNSQGYFVWNGRPTQSLDQGTTFFLQLYVSGTGTNASDPFATSEYFNISKPADASSSASTSKSVTTVTASTSSVSGAASSSSTAGTQPSTSAVASSPANNNLAIGLGAGLGCALLLTFLAAALFLFRRHKRKLQSAIPPESAPEVYTRGDVDPAKEAYTAYQGQLPYPTQELPGHSPSMVHL